MSLTLPNLEPITFDRVKAIQTLPKGQTRRKCFRQSGIQDKKGNGTASFSVPFCESIKPIYESMTGNKLRYSPKLGNYWHFLKEQDIDKVREWEANQGDRVFIRDTLSISLALGMYSSNPKESHGTKVGALVHQAKYSNDKPAIKAALQQLIDLSIQTIRSVPYYCEASHLCCIPPHPSKMKHDIPSIVAKNVAKKLNIKNISEAFSFQGTKPELKGLPLEKKWPALESSGIILNDCDIRGRNIILIDDLYHSGTTMQFIAMKLQQAGAEQILGLSMAKNLRN